MNDEALLKIQNTIAKFYDIGQINSIKKDVIGTGENYILDTGSDIYFLKFFAQNSNYDNPAFEIEVCNFLNKKNFPVPEFIPNRQGDYLSETNEVNFHIQRYLDNVETFNVNSLSDILLCESAELLAKMQKALLDSNKQSDKRNGSLNNLYSQDKIIKKQDHFYSVFKDDPDLEQDLKFKKEFLDNYNIENLNLDKITWLTSHGDYNVFQFLIQDEKIKMVCDFSRISNTPVVWELLRSYTLGTKHKIDSEDFKDKFINYTKIYSQYIELQDTDIDNMFPILASQLLISTFGYSDYEKTKNSQSKNLALSRTKTAKRLLEINNDCKFIERIKNTIIHDRS